MVFILSRPVTRYYAGGFWSFPVRRVEIYPVQGLGFLVAICHPVNFNAGEYIHPPFQICTRLVNPLGAIFALFLAGAYPGTFAIAYDFIPSAALGAL